MTPTVAKAYRLLKTILNTAVADEVLPRNPCLLRGAVANGPGAGAADPGRGVRARRRDPAALADARAPRDVVGSAVGRARRSASSSVDLEQGRVTVADQLIETATG